MQGVIAFMPAWQNPGGVNAVACRTVVPTFLCPSDSGNAPADWLGQNNYYGSQGVQFLCDLSESLPSTIAPGETANGPLYYLSKVKFADLTDGTSNTCLFSEKIRGRGNPDPRSDMKIITNQSTMAAAVAA